MSGSRNSFVRGAAVLAAAGLFSRVVGAFYRVVLAAMLGDEGIGLYQYAYPIYSTLLVISTAGIPVALSIIMAEKIALNNQREAARVFKIALLLLTASGLVISLVLFLGAETIAMLVVRDSKAFYPLVAVSPAIFFVTVMASLRGFFQGRQNMVPTAASQILEQLVRVGFSIGLVIFLLPVGLEYAAAGATSGAAAGGLAGLILLAVIFLREKDPIGQRGSGRGESFSEPAARIIGRILSIAVPVTAGSLVIPLLILVDLAVVPRQLQAAGFDVVAARALYGQLTGMAGAVVYFPNVIAVALSMSLVPAVSEARALKDHSLIVRRTSTAVKLTVLFSLPSAAGLFLLAEPVTVFLFNNRDAGYSLAYLSWSVVPLCLYVATTGIIQGLGRPLTPAVNMLYGGIVKVGLSWFLTAIPTLNVGGAALASVAGVGVAAGLNLFHLNRLTGWRGELRQLVVIPGIASALMLLAVYTVFRSIILILEPFLSAGMINAAATVGSILTGAGVYGVAILLAGGLTSEEFLLVPGIGARLLSVAKRFRLLRR